jgi:hypothetical protein
MAGGTIKRGDDQQEHAERPLKRYFDRANAAIELNSSVKNRGDHGDEDRVPQVAAEGELAAELGVVLGGELELAHRLAVGHVDADELVGPGRVDVSGHQADAAQLGQLAHAAVGQLDAVHRLEAVLARHGHALLAVGQQAGRKLRQRRLRS